MTLHYDLARTAALLTAGWPIRNLSRAKRAQEQQTMLTADTICEAAAIRRDREAAFDLARAIVRDAERLVRTAKESTGPARVNIGVHDSDLARAALSLDGACRLDFESSGVDCTSVRVGPVTFYAGVRL